ncbi:MAG: ABC transporter substrate-binding protein [Clostridia bacterium]|nr:ABC transporter substrate-binding protein [Clostridia bacterium]
MKRISAIVAASILVFSCIVPAWADEAPETMSLTVGTPTRISGCFFSGKWGVNSADVDLRELIHGYNTISWEANGDFVIDETVVRQLEAFEESGNRRYRITFNEGLTYNDGSPLAAPDYAFSALLLSSSQFAALGGAPTEMSWLLGYEAFFEGAPFAGVRVIDEHTLDLTIDGRYLPFFYEIVLLNITPYPITVLAPGCEIKDDGQGAYIEGPLTEELLRATVLDEATGYLRNPAVTAGPYVLQSFDEEEQIAQLTKNLYYAGNFEGIVPQIDELTVVHTNPQTALDDVESGRIDLINKISDGAVIEDGMDRVWEDLVRAQSYLRSGKTFLSFACELGPTQSVGVRNAVTRCVNQNEVIAEFTLGHGIPVYAYYGPGQWMAQEAHEELIKYETVLDLTEAAWLLVEDGWVLNENGDAYDKDAGGPRYREAEDGALEKLALKWAQPQETALSGVLEQAMLAHMESIGIEVEITTLPFDELLLHYYRQVDRTYNMFTMSTNFNLAFDPYPAFHTGDAFQGESNRTGLLDEELMKLALAMRQTEVQNNEAYMEHWFNFQDRFHELMPVAPLFSSAYYDFHRNDLQAYHSNAYFSWATAIVYAYIGDPPAEEWGEIEDVPLQMDETFGDDDW